MIEQTQFPFGDNVSDNPKKGNIMAIIVVSALVAATLFITYMTSKINVSDEKR
jgi:hypothetical protein